MADKQNLGIEDVREFLKQKGFENEIVELTDSARTAQLAAEAIGTSVAQIVKSLIFKGSQSGAPILVLASGANRVDEKKVAQVAIAANVRVPNLVRVFMRSAAPKIW